MQLINPNNRINRILFELKATSRLAKLSLFFSIASILLAVYAGVLAYMTIQDSKGYIDIRVPSISEAQGILEQHVRDKNWENLKSQLEKIKRWPDYLDLYYYFLGIYYSNALTTELPERYLNLVGPDSLYFSRARIIIFNKLVLTEGNQDAINKTIDDIESNYVFDEFYFFIKSYDSRMKYTQLLLYYEKFARNYWLHYKFDAKELRFLDLETNTYDFDVSNFPESVRGMRIDYKPLNARYMPAIDFVFLNNLRNKARTECLKKEYANLWLKQSLILNNFTEEKVKSILLNIQTMLGVDALNAVISYKDSKKSIADLGCKDKAPNGLMNTIPPRDLHNY